MNQVRRCGQACGPEAGLLGVLRFSGSMINGEIAAFVSNNLIQRNLIIIIIFWPRLDDRFVLDVDKDLSIRRPGEPDSAITPFIKQIPLAILEPGGRRTVRSIRNWFAVRKTDVEAPNPVPFDAIARRE